MFHGFHRNVSAPPWFDSNMVVTNSAVDDFDIARLTCSLTRSPFFGSAEAGVFGLLDCPQRWTGVVRLLGSSSPSGGRMPRWTS